MKISLKILSGKSRAMGKQLKRILIREPKLRKRLFWKTGQEQDPTISVNTEKFTTGMYLLNIKTDNGRIYNSKLLKQ